MKSRPEQGTGARSYLLVRGAELTMSEEKGCCPLIFVTELQHHVTRSYEHPSAHPDKVFVENFMRCEGEIGHGQLHTDRLVNGISGTPLPRMRVQIISSKKGVLPWIMLCITLDTML